MARIKSLLIDYFDKIAERITSDIKRDIEETKILQAKNIINSWKDKPTTGKSIRDFEFSVFSQFGDDGIIQYLISQIDIEQSRFIEFGVEDYTESNTKFLLVNDNWSGLIFDGSQKNIDKVRRDRIYWRHDLTADCQFITKENINDLIEKNGFAGKIGLLHIDIDGNDYWVWEAITVIDPDIVIVEYNGTFGKDLAVTVPYDPAFERRKAHHSCLFWGCSVSALVMLAKKKGYVFVGCNSNGNNAYFVKKEKAGKLAALTPAEGYAESKFRESRDEHQRLTFLSGKARIKAIEEMELVDVASNQKAKIKTLLKKRAKL